MARSGSSSRSQGRHLLKRCAIGGRASLGTASRDKPGTNFGHVGLASGRWSWTGQALPSQRRPAGVASAEGVGRGLGRLYGTAVPQRQEEVPGAFQKHPRNLCAEPRRHRSVETSPVLYRALSGSSNGGASPRRADLTEPAPPVETPPDRFPPLVGLRPGSCTTSPKYVPGFCAVLSWSARLSGSSPGPCRPRSTSSRKN